MRLTERDKLLNTAFVVWEVFGYSIRQGELLILQIKPQREIPEALDLSIV
jgi:hypothetical protein